MTLLNHDLADLRKQARHIASNGKDARHAWSELRHWASTRGPIAMKSATLEFVTAYGTTPEAALILPEVMRNMPFLFSPDEKRELMCMAAPKSGVFDIRTPTRIVLPKSLLPLSSERPSLSLSFKPAPVDLPHLGSSLLVPVSAPASFAPDISRRVREKLIQVALDIRQPSDSFSAAGAGGNREPGNPDIDKYSPRNSQKRADGISTSGQSDLRQIPPHIPSTMSSTPDINSYGHGEHILRALTHQVTYHGYGLHHSSVPVSNNPTPAPNVSKIRLRKALRKIRPRNSRKLKTKPVAKIPAVKTLARKINKNITKTSRTATMARITAKKKSSGKFARSSTMRKTTAKGKRTNR